MAEIPKIILRIETSVAYGRGLLYGIAEYSRIHGPWAFYSEPGAEQTTLPRLDKWGATGIITRIPDESNLEPFIGDGLPTIFVPLKEKIPGFPNLIDDCHAAGKMAAEHLLDRGFRNFAFCGFSDMHWSRDRRQGFTKTIATAGFETQCYEQPRAGVVRYYQKEQRLLADWLNLLPKPVGIMTCDDEHGRHVVEACKFAGLRVPEQVAIVGVDNDELVCALSDPPLSSVAVNTRKAGYEAAALLDRLMTGEEEMADQKIIVRPLYVVTRQSTDVLAVEDREVAEALRFIQQNANRPIQVTDAASAAALSRRVLEKRFRKIMGRSIYSEINRQRIGRVARMLVETDHSISQIALSLRYPSVKHIARSFRRQMGMSPLAYRKKFGFK
jgi:LacI family transcriptional regulator